MNDLKFAFRQLLKNPGFTAVAVLTLALGIGANTAIFSVVNAVLLRPLPYPESERLVWLSERGPNFPTMSISYPNFSDWRAQQTVFEHIGVYNWGSYTLTGKGQPHRLTGVRISADGFAALRAQPAIGRLFDNDEDKPGAPSVAVLSHALWADRFGGDAGAVNQSITLDGRPYTVIGVMPVGFDFPSRTDLWLPVGPLSNEERSPSMPEAATHVGSGKVRELFELDEERLLLVASDRISTFDVVLPTEIPDKGRVLTGLSGFWFARTRELVPNHLLGLRDDGCSSPARTWRTCCSPARRRDRKKWPCARRWAQAGGGSSGSCSPKACCWRSPAARSVCCSLTAECG